ncbi:MAG TPA: hypothetical protein VGG06_10835, partial [Thermoanaerobaculia bacterium]
METAQSRYRCPSCDALRDEEICPVCGILTEPVTAGAEEPSTPRTDAPRTVEAPPPPPEPATAAPAEPSRPVRRRLPQAGQQQLAQYVDDGYEVYLIAGIAAAGKTQLLDAYRKDAFLSSFVKRDGLALPTSPDRLDCHPVSLGRRKAVFVDTSGEVFRNLYPNLAGEISEGEIDFLRLVGRRLAGVVYLLDLQRLWNPAHRANPEHEAQVEILAWMLVLLRWLQRPLGGRGGDSKRAPGSRIPFQEDVNRDVMRHRRRLKVPVLVLFSRADELNDLALPGSSRTLYPVGESPLLLAYHLLPRLLEVLATHVDHFRLDFVHSLVTDHDTGEIVDPEACGVSLSLSWLLDGSWRWPALPTR